MLVQGFGLYALGSGLSYLLMLPMVWKMAVIIR